MLVALCSDLDVVYRRGRFDPSWMRIFIDAPIADDAGALLQNRDLVLCGVGSWHDDVIVVLVVLNTGRNRVMGILEDPLNDVDALLVQKILHGLDVVLMESSLC